MCGDRNWTDKDLIRTVFLALPKVSVLIEGEAKGADTLSREVAEENNIAVLRFPALWQKYHRAAGPIRNTQMLEEGKPDIVIAFHDNLAESKGTLNMVNQSFHARKIVVKVSHEEIIMPLKTIKIVNKTQQEIHNILKKYFLILLESNNKVKIDYQKKLC